MPVTFNVARAKGITRAILRSMSTPGGSVFAMTVADLSHDECKEMISLWKRENTKKIMGIRYLFMDAQKGKI